MILKRFLKYGVRVWNGLFGTGYGVVTRGCEHGKETSGLMKGQGGKLK
jgi:hypothetical protein